jgi:hypothetical protein
MSAADSNPPITLWLRVFTFFVLLVLIVSGIGVFFLPGTVRPIWPWELPPFNAAFIGAIYLSSVPAIGMMAFSGRWFPSRVVLMMLVTFTGIGLIMSLLNLSHFQFQNWITWLWFFIYVSLSTNSAVHLWLYRHMPPPPPIAIPAAWRAYLLGQSVVLGLYGLGQFVAPTVVSTFWPWAIDSLHGRLYSGAFAAAAVGGVVVLRGAARSELLALILTQTGMALLSVGGLVLVDNTVHRVDWSAPGTWVWIGAFVVLAAAGLGMLRLLRAAQSTA